jgi:hypothetical protein
MSFSNDDSYNVYAGRDVITTVFNIANMFVGVESAQDAATGSNNIGAQYNVIVGNRTTVSSVDNGYNIALGTEATSNATFNTGNIMMGQGSAIFTYNVRDSTYLGGFTGLNGFGGRNNVFIGNNTGSFTERVFGNTNDSNILLGTENFIDTFSNSSNIGVGVNSLSQLESVSNVLAFGNAIPPLVSVNNALLVGHQTVSTGYTGSNLLCIGQYGSLTSTNDRLLVGYSVSSNPGSFALGLSGRPFFHVSSSVFEVNGSNHFLQGMICSPQVALVTNQNNTGVLPSSPAIFIDRNFEPVSIRFNLSDPSLINTDIVLVNNSVKELNLSGRFLLTGRSSNAVFESDTIRSSIIRKYRPQLLSGNQVVYTRGRDIFTDFQTLTYRGLIRNTSNTSPYTPSNYDVFYNFQRDGLQREYPDLLDQEYSEFDVYYDGTFYPFFVFDVRATESYASFYKELFVYRRENPLAEPEFWRSKTEISGDSLMRVMLEDNGFFIGLPPNFDAINEPLSNYELMYISGMNFTSIFDTVPDLPTGENLNGDMAFIKNTNNALPYPLYYLYFDDEGGNSGWNNIGYLGTPGDLYVPPNVTGGQLERPSTFDSNVQPTNLSSTIFAILDGTELYDSNWSAVTNDIVSNMSGVQTLFVVDKNII